MRDQLPFSTSEVRALPIFEIVPAGHFAMAIDSEDFAPHLQIGECAVIDTNDKHPQRGELFAMVLSGGTLQEKRVVVQVRRQSANGGLWYGFHFTGNGGVLFGGRLLTYVDGPTPLDYWMREKCLGRVVGVMETAAVRRVSA